MEKHKVIAAGHICLDITPVFPPQREVGDIGELLVPGKLIHTDPADVHSGGSVANTGLALSILGNDVTLLGKIGDDAFGRMVEQIVSQYGAGGLIVDPDSSTSYSVVLAVPGLDRIFLHNPGANDTFCRKDIPEKALYGAELFHFGYPPIMRRMYADGGEELAEIFSEMKARGMATSLDMAAIDPNSEAGAADWEKILSKTLPYVDFFVPSFEELCFMLDREKYRLLDSMGGDMIRHISVERDVKPLAERTLRMGCRSALIKCGVAGLYYLTGDMSKTGGRLQMDPSSWSFREGFQPSFRAETVRSATGAGDASIAAFLTAVLMGKEPGECAALAAAEGACAVTAYDALSGLKTIDELETKIASGWEKMEGDRKCL